MLLGRARVRSRFLYVVHVTGGLVVLIAKAGDGGHVVVVLALGTGIIRSVLARILLNVFYRTISPVRTCLCSSS